MSSRVPISFKGLIIVENNKSTYFFLLFIIAVIIHKCNYLFSQHYGLNIQSIFSFSLLFFPIIFLSISYHFNKEASPLFINSRFVNLILIYTHLLLFYGLVRGNSITVILNEYWTSWIVLFSYKLANSKSIWKLFEKELFYIFLIAAYFVYLGVGYAQEHLLVDHFDASRIDSVTVASVAYDISPILDFWPLIVVYSIFKKERKFRAVHLKYLVPFVIYLAFQFYFLKRAPTIRSIFQILILFLIARVYFDWSRKVVLRITSLFIVVVLLVVLFFPQNLMERFKTNDDSRQEELLNMFSQLNVLEMLVGRGLGGEFISANNGVVERIDSDGNGVKSTLHIGIGDTVLKGGLFFLSLISFHIIYLFSRLLLNIKKCSQEQFTAFCLLICFVTFRFIEGGITPGAIFNGMLFGLCIGILEKKFV